MRRFLVIPLLYEAGSDLVKVLLLDELIVLGQNLGQGKMKKKRRQLSLHDSLKNLYLKHFSRYGRSNPNTFEEDYEDPINYY